ncbi:hypothetical protein BpHYR1_030351 [Brachionus plicatilis]|uniref:Uncharacterized protein n=1 Tax=Brachionus plicatilis TaxID=10195 RepID=A0A3M7RBQ3_BRAPC|nr:hypothetical protein BpHYR1_030351 [Brachionus plicatilis]
MNSLNVSSVSYYEKLNKLVVNEYFLNNGCIKNETNTIYSELRKSDCKLDVNFSSSFEFNDLPTLESPAKFYRSDIIKYSTKLALFWTIYALDENDTIIEPEIKLEGNPTVNYSELVIKSNTLNYNKYKLVQNIMIKIDTGNVKNVKNEINYTAEAYIHVVPSGIAPYSLENGLDYLKIGTNQCFTLKPLEYAYDMDLLAQTDSLNFEFFCFVVDKNHSIENKSDLQDFQNLAEFKYNLSLTNKCFSSRDKLEFEANNRTLKIKPNGLNYSKNNSYLFLVLTHHLGKEYYQIVTVEVLDFTKIPIVKLIYDANIKEESIWFTRPENKNYSHNRYVSPDRLGPELKKIRKCEKKHKKILKLLNRLFIKICTVVFRIYNILR